MRRKIFDVLVSAGGLIAVVVLLAAGALLMWGYSFASSSVHGQLVQQDIFFTTQGGAGLANPATAKLLDQYVGQQVLTGPQAKAYADDEIGPELSSMPYGGVYSRISAASQANPKNARLASLVQTVSRERALRGLLLEAYNFWTFGQVVLWVGIGSFILAGLLALFVGFGFWHARRVPAGEQIFALAATAFDARIAGVEQQGQTARHRAGHLGMHLR